MTMHLTQAALLFYIVSASNFLLSIETFAKAEPQDRHSTCDGSNEPNVSASRTSVDLGWSGGSSIDINIPVQVEYQTSAKFSAIVIGNSDVISHVRMRDSKLMWDREDYRPCANPSDIVVHIVGPSVTAWTLNGPGRLNLNTISQDTLKITSHGTGSVTADGYVKDVVLRSSGPARVDLSKLETQRASVQIRGSGEIDIAPREDADISTSGPAVVKIYGSHAKLHVRSHGSAQVIQVP
ncbi:GIN domain-containing protein [Methylobacterium brachiatum]|uniref:DUF2807 domain-containing protein n=1 Tax=Methylobacterium brachiatum TaxID=269660 RepID=A0ABV1R494_9HYPH